MNYTPSAPTAWPSPTPSTIPQALDELAAQTNAGSPIVTIQAEGVIPTCGSPQLGALVSTSGYTLCICNGSQWVQRLSDKTLPCSF